MFAGVVTNNFSQFINAANRCNDWIFCANLWHRSYVVCHFALLTLSDIHRRAAATSLTSFSFLMLKSNVRQIQTTTGHFPKWLILAWRNHTNNTDQTFWIFWWDTLWQCHYQFDNCWILSFVCATTINNWKPIRFGLGTVGKCKNNSKIGFICVDISHVFASTVCCML